MRSLTLLKEDFWICKASSLPKDFLAAVKDPKGLTVVSTERLGRCAGPYKALVSEEMELEVVGFLAEVASLLASVGVPFMVYASYERFHTRAFQGPRKGSRSLEARRLPREGDERHSPAGAVMNEPASDPFTCRASRTS